MTDPLAMSTVVPIVTLARPRVLSKLLICTVPGSDTPERETNVPLRSNWIRIDVRNRYASGGLHKPSVGKIETIPSISCHGVSPSVQALVENAVRARIVKHALIIVEAAQNIGVEVTAR